VKAFTTLRDTNHRLRCARNSLRGDVAKLGTLGSGNHYLEVQRVARIFHPEPARAFGLKVNDIVVSIHCRSRGLGHQVGTDYLKTMVSEGYQPIPDRELACAPIRSKLGKAILLRELARWGSAPCVRPQIVRWLTGRSSRIWRGPRLPKCFPKSG
jgi:RNA-splicing ligase RtcB